MNRIRNKQAQKDYSQQKSNSEYYKGILKKKYTPLSCKNIKEMDKYLYSFKPPKFNL